MVSFSFDRTALLDHPTTSTPPSQSRKAHLLKRVVYRASALYWRIRTRGRIEGKSFRIKRPEMVRITSRLMMGEEAVIDSGARLVVHDECYIGRGVYIGRDFTMGAYKPIKIGDRTLLGERVSLHTETHGPAGDRNRFSKAPINIGDDVWICAGVVITSGVTIGAKSTVAANAVVNRSFGDGLLLAGVPAVEKHQLEP
jgi:maltose O-acetyltransferase